jgi:hypothetical protein
MSWAWRLLGTRRARGDRGCNEIGGRGPKVARPRPASPPAQWPMAMYITNTSAVVPSDLEKPLILDFPCVVTRAPNISCHPTLSLWNPVDILETSLHSYTCKHRFRSKPLWCGGGGSSSAAIWGTTPASVRSNLDGGDAGLWLSVFGVLTMAGGPCAS